LGGCRVSLVLVCARATPLDSAAVAHHPRSPPLTSTLHTPHSKKQRPTASLGPSCQRPSHTRRGGRVCRQRPVSAHRFSCGTGWQRSIH